MSNFEFQNILHRDASEMIYAIALEWLTAGGMKSELAIAASLRTMSAEQLTQQAMSGWGLRAKADNDETDQAGIAPRTWLEVRDANREMIVTAFRGLGAK